MGMGLNCYYVHKFILATIKVRPLFTKRLVFRKVVEGLGTAGTYLKLPLQQWGASNMFTSDKGNKELHFLMIS